MRGVKSSYVMCCSLIVIAAMSATSYADGTLKWKFVAGTKTNYEQELKQEQKLNAGGQNIDINMTMKMDYSMEVKSVNSSDATADVVMRFNRIQMKMENPAAPVDIDTDVKNNDDNPSRKVFDAMVGSDFLMTMTETGAFTKATMPEKLKKEMDALGPAAQQMGFLSEDSLKQMMGGMLSFPKEPLTIGKKWNHEFSVKNAMMTVKNNIEYTYEGQVTQNGKKLEKIAFKPKMSMDGGGLMQIEVKEQTTDGTILFDAEAGHIHEMNADQKFTLGIKAGGQDIESKMTQTTKLKLK